MSLEYVSNFSPPALLVFTDWFAPEFACSLFPNMHNKWNALIFVFVTFYNKVAYGNTDRKLELFAV